MKNFNYLLENYKKADWERFYQCFQWQECPTGIVENDIWSALKYLVSTDDHVVLQWLEEKIPALDGCTPVKVLQLPDGDKILRAMIMRMPC